MSVRGGDERGTVYIMVRSLVSRTYPTEPLHSFTVDQLNGCGSAHGPFTLEVEQNNSI